MVNGYINCPAKLAGYINKNAVTNKGQLFDAPGVFNEIIELIKLEKPVAFVLEIDTQVREGGAIAVGVGLAIGVKSANGNYSQVFLTVDTPLGKFILLSTSAQPDKATIVNSIV